MRLSRTVRALCVVIRVRMLYQDQYYMHMYTMTRQCTVSMSCNHHMRNLCLLLAQYLLHVLYCTLIYLSPQKYESEVEDIPIKSYKSLYLATARYT